MLTIIRADGYELSADPDRLDVDRIHQWLSTDAYWALGRPREIVSRSIAGSVPYGIYRPGDGAQVAFARTVTDGATFAWLSDVYVDPAARGSGLGRWLASTIRDELAARGVYRILLATDDAHGVYAKLGFVPLRQVQRWMELDHPRGLTPEGWSPGLHPDGQPTAGLHAAGPHPGDRPAGDQPG